MCAFNWMAITSSALAISVGAIYYFFKSKQPRYAVEAFNYLTIKVINSEEDCEEVVNEIRR